MANLGSYNSDKASDIDYGIDPASGGFFNSDYKKHDDLKQMLDMNKDSMKLEAMKRIIGMMAKGRDASDLFPAVVKNVVSKNIEVKKLVYVYLARYAEEQQDLALLSISTFQRALKDPNQLIRASALRVLSSIRVPMIIPIVMLAIKDSALDMSPYVRKTAAHAIPKLYSLDPEQKEELVLVIEKLLQDKTTLVVGSAVMAFEEVCPERIDMIHKSYRKLCNLLVDVDEWGQVFILNMLTRYARTQFTDPNLNDGSADEEEDLDAEDKKPFYDDDTGQVSSPRENLVVELDPDHRLLLKNAKPLLQSRNAAVVMAVAQLFHHLAPRREVSVIAKALVRLLRASREVQTVVLTTIASLAAKRRALFVPYLKSFFVRCSDPTQVKTLKLQLLTTLASESSIGCILREFQTYISSVDKAFVAATVQAIGKCAANIAQVTDTCLTGLVSLLSNSDEAVVGESVVVIKNLLQTSPESYVDIIRHMVRLSDAITVPAARAAILWLLGEYSHLVPALGPDVLRKYAKSFVNEEDIVKLQVLNLAVKLYLRNSEQTLLLCQYVLSLARYDENYDIRDRARLLRLLLFPAPSESGPENRFTREARHIFLVAKPAPAASPPESDLDAHQLGSLSAHIHARAPGYLELPPWAATAPDPAARQTATPPPSDITEERGALSARAREVGGTGTAGEGGKGGKSAFYTSGSESESSADEESDEEESGDNEESGGESEEESSSEEESEEESSSEEEVKPASKGGKKAVTPVSGKSKATVNKSQDSSSKKTPASNSKQSTGNGKANSTSSSQARSNVDLLLDLDDFSIGGSSSLITPTLGGFLSPLTANNSIPSANSGSQAAATISSLPAAYAVPRFTEALNKIAGGRGVLSAQAAFTRVPCIASPRMIVVALRLTNHHSGEVTRLRLDVEGSTLGHGMSLQAFPEIPSLGPGVSTEVSLGVNLSDSTQPLAPRVSWAVEGAPMVGELKISVPVGEWLRAVTMGVELFEAEKGKLTGMNEHKGKLSTSAKLPVAPAAVFQMANVGLVPSSDSVLRLAGTSVSSGCLVLISIDSGDLTVNCEKMVLGSMLLNDLVKHLNSV